jgi:hypothetical protein
MLLVILGIYTYALLTLKVRSKRVEETEIIKEKPTVTITLEEFQNLKQKGRMK